ncbi:MAG: DinB family protein [Clostridia bacterium]|nr:DinB family protein [Clostridia bacterium]
MDPLSDDIRYLTGRALWETENLMACVPDALWTKRYDGIPLWKYLYHMLYSMDRWFVNPHDPDYRDPAFHTKTLADLNVIPVEGECLSREQLGEYFLAVKKKIEAYLASLRDDMLAERPENCDMSRLRLILGQHRHWHRHMGVVYGFLIEDTGKWPYVLNMNGKYPGDPMPNYYP